MKAQEYPIVHFKLMVDIATGLAPLPAQILEHAYYYESFGSWWFICRCSGKRFRVVFDGRDALLSVQLHTGDIWEDKLSSKIDLNAKDILNLVLPTIKPRV